MQDNFRLSSGSEVHIAFFSVITNQGERVVKPFCILAFSQHLQAFLNQTVQADLATPGQLGLRWNKVPLAISK